MLLLYDFSFSVNPYLLSLVEWRNAMNEEAAALVHASKGMNKALSKSKVALCRERSQCDLMDNLFLTCCVHPQKRFLPFRLSLL